jgi:hypothetical protein
MHFSIVPGARLTLIISSLKQRQNKSDTNDFSHLIGDGGSLPLPEARFKTAGVDATR